MPPKADNYSLKLKELELKEVSSLEYFKKRLRVCAEKQSRSFANPSPEILKTLKSFPKLFLSTKFFGTKNEVDTFLITDMIN